MEMPHVLRAALLLSSGALGVAAASQIPLRSNAVLASEFVFESAPFASAHASSLAETAAGLVAAWFGGTREGAPDVGIWLSRRVGVRWTPPTEVANGIQADGTRYPCWNPVLFAVPGKMLMLFYKVGPSPQRWWGMVQTSLDNGQTWQRARRLPDGILGPIKNKPVLLSDGTLLAPSSSESPESPSRWRVHFETSRDFGETWTSVAPDPGSAQTAIDAIQPSVLFHPAGRLQAVGRTRAGRIFETWSSDNGHTWTPLALTSLPNPNSGIDAITLRDGRHLIVYNHTAQGRSPLNVALSQDGKTWQAALVLEREPGEFSYPAVIQTREGRVHISYTWKRERIKHVTLDSRALSGVPMSNGKWPDDQ